MRRYVLFILVEGCHHGKEGMREAHEKQEENNVGGHLLWEHGAVRVAIYLVPAESPALFGAC